MSFRYFALGLLFLAFLPASGNAGEHVPVEIVGSSIKNHDGDTLKLSTATHGVIDVRLSGVDAPETGQAHWRAARGALNELVAGKPVTAWCYKTDKYDREVCHVSVSGDDVGLRLIQGGYAWYAPMFAHELTATQQKTYPEAEEQARRQRIGLWQEPEPMPPWECRKLRKAHQKCW